MSIFPNPSPTSGGQPPAAPMGPPPSAPPPPASFTSGPYAPPPPPVSGGTGKKIPLLFGAVIALLGANVYLYMQLDHVKKDLANVNSTMQAQLDKLQEASSLTTRSNTRKVEELKDQLERARRQAALAAGAAKDEALKKVEETRSQLEAAQQQAEQQLNSDISKVREQTATVDNRV